MDLLKMLIGIPLLIVIMIFAFVNNDFATFSLWPFSIEITVSLSVAIVFLIFIGFVFGVLFSWLSYAPVRKSLRMQKKQCKVLTKEQMKLIKQMEDLHEDLENLKATEIREEVVISPSFSDRIKNSFKKKEKNKEAFNDDDMLSF